MADTKRRSVLHTIHQLSKHELSACCLLTTSAQMDQ